ncbi:uncharacterized protein [Physcomitrium patens]|uniref:CCR4-NOT transcription complex subunit 1 n=1 Tax=Physcomitrium patens TaxID=3218 RepID=A0A2K1KIP2_PHYPA|nr:CCR4-NOT transcription complex subunit 1-like [Physcomitrium patens]XP_024374833.1 CCR4-NOT transcription complex subunit 1-like [Physcomitrium patens]PNR53656.1 hypothetical protein PHYPA_007331 [Physcomitrium patens]|eukprot:XP_024374832.1 CCR4-NOT transcription complex subunit 1-like [Physcomitrella patens]
MIPCGSPLAAQIGFQVANLSKDNYKSVVKELYELISYGPDGSIILLRSCLEQVNLAENDQNLQVKLDLLAIVIRDLIRQPNLGTVLCEALQNLPSVSEEFLANLCRALDLSLSEQLALGLALADAEDNSQRQQGQAFLETKVTEWCHTPTSDLSEDLIERILWCLYSSESLLELRSSFLKSLHALQPFAVDSLTLTPFLKDVNKEVDCLRDYDVAKKSGSLLSETLLMELERATDVVSLLEELGFDCTYSVDHCKEILSQGGPLIESDIARILGTVARTAKGFEEVQSIHGPFYNLLCSGEPIPSKLTTWHVEILLGAINQLNPSMDWSLIVSSLDYEGFFLSDEHAFTLFMTMYKLGCEDPFPIDAVCGRVWKNYEGQLSFLRHAISATPEVFTFAHSTRKLTETHEGKLKSPNHAWLSLDLLEALCRLAEVDRSDQVHEILEFPRNHCPELLALGLVQVNIGVSLKGSQESFREEMLSLVLRPLFAQINLTTEGETVDPLWSKLWSLNSDALKMEMVNYLCSGDPSAYDQVTQVCRGLKVLPAVLDSMPSKVALKLAVFAARKGVLNLEKWLEEELTIHRDSFAAVCLSFLQKKNSMFDEMNGSIEHSGNQLSDISAAILKVLYAASGLLSSGDLVNRIVRARGSENLKSLDAGLASIEASPQENDVDKEANSYFERVYRGEVPVQTVVNMLQQFNQSPPNSREKAIFSRMVSCLFDELPHLNQFPEKALAVTAVLFGSLIKHQLVSTSTLEKALTCILGALTKPVGTKMFSFAIQALDSFRERLKEWPEFCYHILQVPHIREAQNELVDFIMNIVKANHVADPNSVNDSNEPSVVALPSTVNAPRSVLQDSQDEIFNSAFAAVDPAGNRFSSSQLRYLSGQGLEALLQSPAGNFPSGAGTQPQNGTQSVAQSNLDSLLSSQAGFRTSSESPFQSISRTSSTTLSQHPQSQYSSVEETPDGARSDAQVMQNATTSNLQANRASEVAVSQQQSSTESTNLSAAAPYFPFSAAPNGQTNQASMRTSARSANVSGSLRTAISGFGHALNIETLVAAAGKRDKPIEAPSSEIQDKVAFIINNISWTNLEAKAKECAEILKEEYHPWFAQYVVMKRASIEPNNHDTYIKFLDKIGSKELHKEVLKTTYENCKVLLASNLIKTHSEERSLLKNLGSWLGKLTIRRNQSLRARELDPKSLIIRAYQKGLMIAIIPFTSKVLEPCNQSLAYQPPNPWTMAILSLLVEIYNLPNLKMNLKFDIEVLFKNLNVDMKEVKPSKLLEGLEREVEGNPDFSNKDPVFSQSPSPALSANNSSQSVTVPSLPQQLDIPPELPIPTQPATSLASSVISQLIEEERPSLALDRSQNGQASSISSQPSFSSSQVSMAIPDLTSYVVLNPKFTGLGQQLQLARIVPLAMERAIREIISPVVDRSVTIACMTTRELVVKDYAMEADETRTNQSANLMVASLAGSLAHVTCKEPLRVSMANYLRTFLQTALAQDVLEQAVNLVTNDNLDLGCAVIEKAATEKAQRDLEEVIAPVLALRRTDRLRLGSAYYDKYTYANRNLSSLPEALRPRPGRLSAAQARVYEDFARLPWQNQPSHTPVTSASPPGITSLSGRGIYAVPSREAGANSIASFNVNQSSSVLGATSQVSDLSSDELDIREPSPISFSSTASVGGADGQSRHSLETPLPFPTYSSASTPPPELTAVETPNTSKGTLGTTPSSTPPLPTEHIGSTVQEPSLTTGEALEKFSSVAQKLDLALSRASSFSPSLPLDDEVRVPVNEVPEIILQCVSRDEAALAIAQKVFKRLYENTTSQLHVVVHLSILESIRDVCRRVVKELTSWVVYSDEDRKFNREITVGLIRSELINLTDYSLHLTKWIDGGRNKDAVDFAAYLVKTCVIEEAGVTSTEFYNVIDALGKLAARPGSPESLQQLVEIAKGTPSANKDEKGRLSKEKKLPSSRSAGLRDDGKSGMRETADPPGLREQATQFFQEWARICTTPGGPNEKANSIYISQLQSTGMLKGDDVTDRFFRILIELAESHCLNSETPQPTTAVGESRQQGGSTMSFAAIDMVAKLVVLLVKYSSEPSLNKVNLLTKVLNVTVRVMKRDHDRKAGFHPRPYFRLFVTWLLDFNSSDSTLDSSNFQVLQAFANAFLALQPLEIPGFSFAWLELISHRTFMPKLLLSNSQKGWAPFQKLLVALFKFMEPYLRKADLSEPVRVLYKGTLRVLLVLLHDFPEFLCDHHFSFCDVIPPSCIQMRNLILSAFPRNMRLPDPFTPNLKVDLLPEISMSPRILSDVEGALKAKQLKSEVDDFIKNRNQATLLSMDLKGRLTLSTQEAQASGTRYNVPLLNALVLYVGMQAVQQLHSKTSQQLAALTAPITHSAPMDIFQRLVNDLDTEGRYLFLNAVANQLRYPNNHTYYFSCVLLFLFAEASLEIIQEQITRVLLERLIVNRPHPWGLLITFIELIKNPRYSFWTHGFTRCAPEIDKLFESVARSCMNSTLKPSDDDLPGNLPADGLKG